jgi:hypothetical protein
MGPRNLPGTTSVGASPQREAGQALAAEGGPALRGAILVRQALIFEELGDRDRAGALLRESEGYLATFPR